MSIEKGYYLTPFPFRTLHKSYFFKRTTTDRLNIQLGWMEPADQKLLAPNFLLTYT